MHHVGVCGAALQTRIPPKVVSTKHILRAKMHRGRPMMHGQGSPSEPEHCDWDFSLRARRCATAWQPGPSRDRESFDERSPERQAQRQKQLNDPYDRPIMWALRMREKSCSQKGRHSPRRPLKRGTCFAVNDQVQFLSADTGRWRRGQVEATCTHTGTKHRDWAIVSVRRNGGAYDWEAFDMSSIVFADAG
jgi:hypothetical protein